MDEQLQRLSRGEQLPQPGIQDSRSPGPAAGPARAPRVDHSELTAEGNTFSAPQSPGDEASPAGPDTSDQPSYVLRARDGKMRFFG